MGSPAPPPVQQVPTFTIPGAGAGFVSNPVLMFTVPLGVPARIDGIFLNITSVSVALSFLSEQYMIQIAAPGNPIQYEIWSPILDTGEDVLTSAVAQLTWMVGGVGTDQLPLLTYNKSGSGDINAGLMAATMALPVSVLQPNATVSVVRTGLEIAGDVQVDGVVTYTPNGTGTSTTASANVLPFLVPQG